MIKFKFSHDKDFPFAGIYRIMSFVVVPMIIGFLVLDYFNPINISDFYKSLLIYILVMLIVLAILARIKAFEKYFFYTHYAFLFGVMLINLFWFGYSPNEYDHIILVAAFSLIGLALIEPRYTLGFYVVSLIIYYTIAVNKGLVNFQIIFLLSSISFVITLFNFWRHAIFEHLKNSGRTYKDIFDSSHEQIFVVSKNLEIKEISKAADHFLKNRGMKSVIGLEFNEVFQPETEECRENFQKALKQCEEEGNSEFQANCTIKGMNDFQLNQFLIRKSNFFDNEVYIINVRLIAEQKAFEKELLEHKDNVTQILENISYFVFNISFDASERFKHHVNFVSSRVKEVYGYSVDEYITLVKSEKIDKDRHPDDRDAINERFQQLLEIGGKDAWKFRMKVSGKSGWRWIQEKLFVEHNSDGKMVSLFGMVKDVTDEIMAEQKLIESERRYRQIFETNLAGVYKTNTSGKVLDCNPAFAEILGYSSIEEVMKMDISTIYFSKKEREDYIALLKEHKQLNNHTLHVKRKDGRRLIVNNNVSLLADESGEENTIVGTLVDVTDLHETSIALKHSEEKYRMLFEESNSAILLLILDVDGSFVVDANQKAAALFDMDQDEIVGCNIADLMNPEMDIQNELKEVVIKLNDGNSFEREWEFVNNRKHSFYAEVSFASVFVEDENVAQIVINDISERKQYEKEILESRLSFKNIVDKSPAGILIFSKSGELMYVNPKGEDLFNSSLNSEERHLYRVFPEEKHALINDLIREAEDDVKSYTEIELGSEDNVKRYSINVIDTVYNFQQANLFIILDISLQTEYNIQKLRAEMAEETNVSLQEEIERHKRTQHSLVESTSRLKALFESAANLYILSIDQNYNVVSFNENFKFMITEKLGKDVEVGDNFMDLFPIEPYALELIVGRFKEVLLGSPSNLVSKFEALNGEVWMESFLSPIQIEGEEVKEISFISHDITEQVGNEEKLRESIKEKEILLKEVHHRVKNNLQVINSILNLQSSYVEDEQTLQIIIESQNRIRSMSYIHESLYQTKDFASIDFQDYITNLVQNLVHSYEVYSDKTELDLKIDKVNLALDQAIPCGLILNELITNALKYAYPEQEGGKITIEVFEKDKKVHVRVLDFGVGLPADFNIGETDSLGLSLVDTLIDQIDGELKLKTESGTEFLIIFDKQEI